MIVRYANWGPRGWPCPAGVGGDPPSSTMSLPFPQCIYPPGTAGGEAALCDLGWCTSLCAHNRRRHQCSGATTRGWTMVAPCRRGRCPSMCPSEFPLYAYVIRQAASSLSLAVPHRHTQSQLPFPSPPPNPPSPNRPSTCVRPLDHKRRGRGSAKVYTCPGVRVAVIRVGATARAWLGVHRGRWRNVRWRKCKERLVVAKPAKARLVRLRHR